MASLSTDTCPDQFKRKKRRLTTDERTVSSSSSSPQQNQRNKRIKRWRTQREQHIYSSKLVQALRRSRRFSATKEVRQTADTVLAVLAKGTTRWSRAILTARATTKTTKHKKAKIAINVNTRPRKMPEIIKTDKRKAPVFERKLKVLGRLVPGGRKLTFSNLLEETIDYIPALEMQVRAMTAITELFAVGARNGGPQPPADRVDSNVNS